MKFVLFEIVLFLIILSMSAISVYISQQHLPVAIALGGSLCGGFIVRDLIGRIPFGLLKRSKKNEIKLTDD